MADHYNLYKSLDLDSNASAEELSTKLNGRLTELRAAGTPEYSGQYQEAYTALQILGNEQRRAEYDAMLADDSADVTISSLRELAARPVQAQPAPAADGFAGVAGAGAAGAGAVSNTTAAMPNSVAQQPQSQMQPQVQSQVQAAQQGQQQWSNQVGQASVTTTVTTEVPPLPANATVQMMWKRMPKIPRIVTGLLGSGVVFGAVMTLYSIATLIYGVNEFDRASSDDTGLFDTISGTFGGTVAIVMVPVLITGGTILNALCCYWVANIMRGGSETTPIFLAVTTGPLAVTMLVSGFMLSGLWQMILTLLVGIALIAVCVMVFLKDMRAWFRGQALVKTTQFAPIQGVQGYAPQTGQVGQANPYDPSNAFAQPSQPSQVSQVTQPTQHDQQSPANQDAKDEGTSQDS